jgi:HEAT repeat protein
MILLFFILTQNIDYEYLYHSATILEVQFKDERDSAFAKLVELAQDSLYADTTMNFLISKFDSKHGRERHGLKDLFVRLGEPAVEYITAHINYRGSDEESRALNQSLWVLGEIGGEAYIDAVSAFIDDKQWQVRSGAYTALGKSESPKARPYLLHGLDDIDPSVRKSAFSALAAIATDSDIEVLIQGLNDSNYGVRYAAVKGLVNLGDTVIAPLLKIFGTNDCTDFFVARVLGALDSLDFDRSRVYAHPRPEVRFAYYDACSSPERLAEALETETNRRLKAYLQRKIVHLQAKDI